MRYAGLLLLTTVLVAVQLGHVLGQLANNVVVDYDKCVCVKYFQCVHNVIITQAGRKFFVPRVNVCSNSLQVCCMPPDTHSSTPAPTITDAPSTSVAAPASDAPPASASLVDASGATCGRGEPSGVGFTLTEASDGETNFGEFPWVVAVLRREVQVGGTILPKYECAGSLIHLQVVLTAAHCVLSLKLNDLMIRAGEWDTRTIDEPNVHQELSVREVIIHEGYDDDLFFNDIALLILEKPVTKDVHINVVCLPTQGETFDHTRCFAAGWGKTVFGKDEPYAVILKKTELPIVPHSTCENALRTARFGPYYKLDDSFVCAGGEKGIDTCKGDGGGPLVCPLVNNPEQFKQVGIVSWGLDCGLDKVPGIYANVAKGRDWIDQKMTANNFGTDSYTYSKPNV